MLELATGDVVSSAPELARLTLNVAAVHHDRYAGGGQRLVYGGHAIREVHGYAKQGAAFGYSKVGGLSIQLATISTSAAAPVIARARLRKGNTASAAGAGRMLAQAIATSRAAGVKGRILARADSAYYGWAFVGTALRHRAWFSVTARMTPSVTASIASIDPAAWKAIEYPNAPIHGSRGSPPPPC